MALELVMLKVLKVSMTPQVLGSAIVALVPKAPNREVTKPTFLESQVAQRYTPLHLKEVNR